jgi:hypothetical protein
MLHIIVTSLHCHFVSCWLTKNTSRTNCRRYVLPSQWIHSRKFANPRCCYYRLHEIHKSSSVCSNCSISFHQNPFSGRRVETCKRTDGHNETHVHSFHAERSKGAFCDLTNSVRFWWRNVGKGKEKRMSPLDCGFYFVWGVQQHTTLAQNPFCKKYVSRFQTGIELQFGNMV